MFSPLPLPHCGEDLENELALEQRDCSSSMHDRLDTAVYQCGTEPNPHCDQIV